MSLPRTVEFEAELEKKVEQFLKDFGYKFSELVSEAVSKFISEAPTVQMAPGSTEEFLDIAKKVMIKHKHALDKLSENDISPETRRRLRGK